MRERNKPAPRQRFRQQQGYGPVVEDAAGENRMTVKVDNDDIIEELRTLRSEMAEMTERMERMRVVLDTGTLVGEMAGPMDNALGQRVTRRGRGN